MSDSKRPDIVVALLQVKTEPWKSIYEIGQLQTWIDDYSESIQIINVYGEAPSRLIRKIDIVHEKLRWNSSTQPLVYVFDWLMGKLLRYWDNPKLKVKKQGKVTNLLIGVPSTNLTLPNVEIALFKYFLNNTTANFLYMSNTSSYINLKNLIKTIKNFSGNNIYGGTIEKFSGLKFASGSNRILSRDLVRFLVKNFNKWEFSYLDDVSMSKLIKNVKINEVNISSLTFSSIAEIEQASNENLQKTVHFRLKSGPLNNRKDAELMHCLHARLTKN